MKRKLAGKNGAVWTYNNDADSWELGAWYINPFKYWNSFEMVYALHNTTTPGTGTIEEATTMRKLATLAELEETK